LVIVTGGAGFIGSALVWRLNQLGHNDILVVDSSDSSDRGENLAGLRFADYCEQEEFLRNLLSGGFDKKVKTIFHLGACSDTTCSDESFLMRNNFEYTKHLALFALRVGARFVYASSAATYGDGTNSYSDDERNIKSLRPLNMYARSKHLFDVWALQQGLLDRIAGLKYFNIFGPNEYHKGPMRSMVCKGFAQTQSDGVIRLFKSYRPEYAHGEQERDFLYVKDAVEMTVFFHNHPEIGGIFNIGSGVANTWNALAKAIFAALELPTRIEYIEMPSELRGKYQYSTRADIGKLRRAGYKKLIISLDKAVSDYVRNYLLPGKHLS
jgi:ADP-L-glycero-D-manno-heptose 6-epimerase